VSLLGLFFFVFRAALTPLSLSAGSTRILGILLVLEMTSIELQTLTSRASALLTPLRLSSHPLFQQDNIVWPAYLKAHRPLFQNGDVEKGQIDTKAISGVELLEARELGMEAMLAKSCETIYRFIEEGKTADVWEKP
jgi:hypothetical protein